MSANRAFAAGGYGPPGGGYPPGGGGYGPPGAPPPPGGYGGPPGGYGGPPGGMPPGGGYGPPGAPPPGGFGAPPPGGFGPPGAFPPGAMPPPGGDVNTTLPLVLSIVCLACCCMPMGIGALVFAMNANKAKQLGDLATAQAKAKTALILAIVGMVGGVIVITIYGVVMAMNGSV